MVHRHGRVATLTLFEEPPITDEMMNFARFWKGFDLPREMIGFTAQRA